MDYLHFVQGLVIWGIVATIIALITYGIAYCGSRVFGFKIQKPWQTLIIIIAGVEIMYIIQTVLQEFGITPESSRSIILMISICIIIIARIYNYLVQQKQKNN